MNGKKAKKRRRIKRWNNVENEHQADTINCEAGGLWEAFGMDDGICCRC